MTIIYYSEINLICIIILLIFANQMRYKSSQLSAESRTFKLILWTTVIMCISDMAAGICRGQFFTGARLLIEISNMIFYEAISVISFLWMVYVFTKLKITKHHKREMLPWAIPIIAISIVTFFNPLTHWMFKIDENNLYTRNIGVYFHWIVSWGYLMIATAITAYKIIKERNKNKRREIIPLILFFIAPAIAAVIQMMFYGVTCSQVGITVSIVVIALMEQNSQILTDEQTGLSNRYGFNKYWENYMQHHSGTTFFLMMIDVNNFKQVNDKFGHMEGDRALVRVADAVKQSCEEAVPKLFACRYGGDEFVISGCNCRPDEIIEVKMRIYEKLEEKNCSESYPYSLSVSIGTAAGTCSDFADIDRLLCVADEMMYNEKKQFKHKTDE